MDKKRRDGNKFDKCARERFSANASPFLAVHLHGSAAVFLERAIRWTLPLAQSGLAASRSCGAPVRYNVHMEDSRTNRREFLQGISARKAAENLLPSEPAPSASPDAGKADPAACAADSYLIQVGRPAMACQFEVMLNAGQHPAATEVALAALDLVDRLEDQLTVYRPHSEVSELNASAALGPVVVERRLFQLLQQAVSLSEDTQGAFDITAGPLSKVWGFFRRSGRLPTTEELDRARQVVGSRFVELEDVQQTVQFRRPGVELNLGAIGKGHALDRCAELLESAGIGDFLIHGGQSSILARGSRLSASLQKPGWHVALRHPLRPDQQLADVWLLDRALGTSGSGQQFFHHQGRRFGHVIDPRTGLSVEGVLSATVLARTAAVADALSTAFFVMGWEQSFEFCRQHDTLGEIIVSPGRRAGELELHSCGLSDDEFRRTC